MKKPFHKIFEENNKTTLKYSINALNNACWRFYDAINDWLIKIIKKIK